MSFELQLTGCRQFFENRTCLSRRHVKQLRHIGAHERTLDSRKFHNQLRVTDVINALLSYIPKRVPCFFIHASRKKIGGCPTGSMRFNEASLNKLSEHAVQSPLVNVGCLPQIAKVHFSLVTDN